MPTLPTDSAERKRYPLFRGLFRYFPAALAGVAHHSLLGNEKHNPGVTELVWSRDKSNDHLDCILRHVVDLSELLKYWEGPDDTLDPELVITEVNALAWRALAVSQEIHEWLREAPASPAAEFDTTI